MFNLANDDVLREHLVVFVFVESHVLSLRDQRSLFFVHEGVDALLDSLVTVTYLCNDKVQKHNASHHDHQEDSDPVQDVLPKGKVLACIEVEITKTHSEYCEDVSYKNSNHIILTVSCLKHVAFFVVVFL